MSALKMRFALAGLALIAAGCAKKPATGVQTAAPAAPPEVRVATADKRAVDRSTAVTGSLIADESVNVSFEVPGTLAKSYADFGQSVRQGQVLAELDKRELTLQVERARAALNQGLARIGLDPAQDGSNPTSTPAIRQALAQMEDAKSKLDSAEKLVKSGDIARERYTEIEKSWRSREAVVQAARDELRTQLAMLGSLRADLKLAEKRLSDAVLRAPFDGAITAKMVSSGQYIKENTPVFTVVKASPLRLRADIPESSVGEVRIGTTLNFVTDAAPGATFNAVVRELNPALDAKSRSLAAEARIAGKDGRLKPGMFVQVQLTTAHNTEVVTVPKEAIYTVAGLTKVFIVRDGKVLERRIQPGMEIGGRVEVPTGVDSGDRVAITNLGILVDGAPVTVIPAAVRG